MKCNLISNRTTIRSNSYLIYFLWFQESSIFVYWFSSFRYMKFRLSYVVDVLFRKDYWYLSVIHLITLIASAVLAKIAQQFMLFCPSSFVPFWSLNKCYFPSVYVINCLCENLLKNQSNFSNIKSLEGKSTSSFSKQA